MKDQVEGNGTSQEGAEAMAEEGAPPQVEASETNITYPGVLVVRIPGDVPGQERIEIQEINGIDGLSVPTTLRIAANIRESQLGLGSK